jgi:hypothetical protein
MLCNTALLCILPTAPAPEAGAKPLQRLLQHRSTHNLEICKYIGQNLPHKQPLMQLAQHFGITATQQQNSNPVIHFQGN